MAEYSNTQRLQAIAIVDEMAARGVAILTEAALITEAPLTATGSTPARSMLGYNKGTYQIDVSGIGTNVVVTVEGNLAGSNYVNLSSTNSDTTITASGTYLFSFEYKLVNVRFTLVSFTGGTPSITAHLLRGN